MMGNPVPDQAPPDKPLPGQSPSDGTDSTGPREPPQKPKPR